MDNKFYENLRHIPEIPKATVFEYENKKELITEYVVERLVEDRSICTYFKAYPENFVYQDQLNFSKLLQTILTTNRYDLLITYLPWYYRSRLFRDFKSDYFEMELLAWREAFLELMGANSKDKLIDLFDWLIENIQTFILNGKKATFEVFSLPREWQKVEGAFFSSVMQGDLDRCLKLAYDTVENGNKLLAFYEHVMRPVMYKVGYYWEMDQLSMLHEQHATNIIVKVREELYNKFIRPIKPNKGSIVISTSNQFAHELGARFIGDLLAYQGWDVAVITGSTTTVSTKVTREAENVFHEKIAEAVKTCSPDLYAISMATALDIWEVRKLMSSMKISGYLNDTTAILGGKIVNDFPEINFAELTGSDFQVSSIQQLLDIIQKQDINKDSNSMNYKKI